MVVSFYLWHWVEREKRPSELLTPHIVKNKSHSANIKITDNIEIQHKYNSHKNTNKEIMKKIVLG